MKQLITPGRFKALFTSLMMCFVQTIVWAQDSTSSSSSSTRTTTTTTTTWYTQPWVWVAGGAILLILIIALMRGSNSKTVEKTTVIRDSSTDRDVRKV